MHSCQTWSLKLNSGLGQDTEQRLWDEYFKGILQTELFIQ